MKHLPKPREPIPEKVLDDDKLETQRARYIALKHKGYSTLQKPMGSLKCGKQIIALERFWINLMDF